MIFDSRSQLANSMDSYAEFPSFFKIMAGDFENTTRIPPAFADYLTHTSLSKKYSLQVSTSRVHKSWRVDVVPVGRHFYFRNEGWKRFLRDQNLKFGDLVVFTLVDDFTFQAVLYDKTCCSRSVSKSQTSRVDVEIEEEGERFVYADFEFQIVFRPRSIYSLRLPTHVVRQLGIKHDTPAIVRDEDGREWKVVVCLRQWGDVDIGKGWNEVAKAHGLKVGDVCELHVVSGPSLLFEFGVRATPCI